MASRARQPRLSRAKKVSAAAMRGLGVPVREIAAELGISKSAAHLAGRDVTLNGEEQKRCQEMFQGRSIVAADRFLSHALDNLNKLGPYQATLCAGIMSDHHLRHRMFASRGGASSVLVQVLVQIDQSARSSDSIPVNPADPIRTETPDVVIDSRQNGS